MLANDAGLLYNRTGIKVALGKSFYLIEKCLDHAWTHISPGVNSKGTKWETDWHIKYVLCLYNPKSVFRQ